MTKSIILAAAAIAALAITGTAAAGAKTIRLEPGHCTRIAGKRVCAAPIRSTKAYTDLQAALNAATGNGASLESEIAQTAAARDAALEQAANLQATIAGQQATIANQQAQITNVTAQLAVVQPPPSKTAVDQVRHEASWAAGGGPGVPMGQLVSEAAMNYVVGHVSTGEYGYLEVNNLPLPLSTPDSILQAQAGICGHAALTFAAIMMRLGYPVRSAQFYYSTPAGAPDSHIAVEVQYAGGWHFYDPTFGVFWTDATGNVQSITDARSSVGTEHKDDASFTNLVENPWYQGDDTAFETDAATTVTLDQNPFAG